MITIEERLTENCPGLTSFFINFDYNLKIVTILKELSCKIYNKESKEWEVPLIYLAKLVDSLITIDDIDIKLLDDASDKIITYDLCSYKTPLFKHQIEAVEYGLNHPRWLLLDLPGCGKSLSAIALANELKAKYNNKHCLIICGLNSLKYNWVKEIHQHSDLSCTILGQRYNRKGKLVIGSLKDRLEHLKKGINEYFIITNLETLRDDKIIKELLKKSKDIDFIVFDELHKAKDPNSMQGANLLKLIKAKYRLGMTGTLLLNSPLDVYVPLRWIGVEKSSFTNFKSLFCEFIGEHHNILKGFKHLDYLRYIIDQVSLRRSNYKDLPELTIIPEFIELENKQRIFYDNIVKGVIEEVDKVKLNTANTLALTTRLRQATALPTILTTESIPSAKIDRACELVDEITANGDKVVIFSTFKATVDALSVALVDYNPVISTGDTKDNLVELVDDFQADPARKVFIGTWQKAGTGITITKASYMIFIDTPWTWGAFEQAYKRIHRTGTTKPVFIYELISKDTFDEDVHNILYDKQALSEYIIDQNESPQIVERLKKHLIDLK